MAQLVWAEPSHLHAAATVLAGPAFVPSRSYALPLTSPRRSAAWAPGLLKHSGAPPTMLGTAMGPDITSAMLPLPFALAAQLQRPRLLQAPLPTSALMQHLGFAAGFRVGTCAGVGTGTGIDTGLGTDKLNVTERSAGTSELAMLATMLGRMGQQAPSDIAIAAASGASARKRTATQAFVPVSPSPRVAQASGLLLAEATKRVKLEATADALASGAAPLVGLDSPASIGSASIGGASSASLSGSECGSCSDAEHEHLRDECGGQRLGPERKSGARKAPARPRGRVCSSSGCTKLARGRGLCKGHGGGRRCQAPTCGKSARSGSQLCMAHGGGRRCRAHGCANGAEGATFHCVSHGGGRRCQAQGCAKKDQGRGLCKQHGGGRRCDVRDCMRSANPKTTRCSMHASLQ